MWCQWCGGKVEAVLVLNVATPTEDEEDVPTLRCCGWCAEVVIPARNRAEARVVNALANGAQLVWREFRDGTMVWSAQELVF